MIFAAFSLNFGFKWRKEVGLTLLNTCLILYFAFFLCSWAKSTTPPFSILIFLKIILSSVLGPLLESIAKDTYKNLFLGFFTDFSLIDLSRLSLLMLLLRLLFKRVFLLSSPINGLLFLFDNRILLNLFIFAKTLYLLLKSSSWPPGTVTWVEPNKAPLLFLLGSYIFVNLLIILFTSPTVILLFNDLLYLSGNSSTEFPLADKFVKIFCLPDVCFICWLGFDVKMFPVLDLIKFLVVLYWKFCSCSSPFLEPAPELFISS